MIHLKAEGIPAYMGLAAKERVEPQPLNMEIKAYFDARKAAKSGDIDHCVDYVRLLGEARFILWTARFMLIETAADLLAKYFLRSSPATAIELTLAKPEALSGPVTPSLTVYREKTESHLALNTLFDWGSLSTESSSKDADVYLLKINAKKHADVKSLKLENAALMTIDPKLSSGETKMPRGSAELVHRLNDSIQNESEQEQRCLITTCKDPAWDWGTTTNPFFLEPHVSKCGFYEAVLNQYISPRIGK